VFSTEKEGRFSSEKLVWNFFIVVETDKSDLDGNRDRQKKHNLDPENPIKF
jgi:hypothetical protein